MYDLVKLKDLYNKAKQARCRSRFVAPVILFEGKVRLQVFRPRGGLVGPIHTGRAGANASKWNLLL